MIKTNKLSQNYVQQTKHFGNLTGTNLFLQFSPLRQTGTTNRNSFLQRNNEKKNLHPTKTRASSLNIQIW